MRRIQNGLIEEYEINPYTLIVQPIQYGSKVYTEIHELEDRYISPFKPLDIIKRSCEYFGSSYEGRKEGTKQLIGITHKPPIAIDPTSSIFFFPTTSPVTAGCIWMANQHIVGTARMDAGTTMITFRNQQAFEIPVSCRSIENQIMRTALLKTKLLQRIQETERQQHFLLTRNGAAEVPAGYPVLKR